MAPPKFNTPTWAPPSEAVAVDVSSVDQSFAAAVASSRGGAVLYVGVAGDVAVTMAGGGNITYKNAPVGWLPVLVSAVLRVGTTAGSVVAAW